MGKKPRKPVSELTNAGARKKVGNGCEEVGMKNIQRAMSCGGVEGVLILWKPEPGHPGKYRLNVISSEVDPTTPLENPGKVEKQVSRYLRLIDQHRYDNIFGLGDDEYARIQTRIGVSTLKRGERVPIGTTYFSEEEAPPIKRPKAVILPPPPPPIHRPLSPADKKDDGCSLLSSIY